MKKTTATLPTCFLFLLFGLVSCMKKSAEKVYDEVASGVVLVMNEQYHTFTLNDSTSLYFSGLERGKLENATFSIDEIAASTHRRYAVGCFVNDKGEILTTDSVTVSALEREDAVKALHRTAKDLILGLSREANAATNYYADLQIKLVDAQSALGVGNYFGTLSDEDMSYYEDRIADIQDSLALLLALSSRYNTYIIGLQKIDYDKVPFQTVSNLGIALNNTFVSSTADFLPCAVRSCREKYALLQLETKSTPSAAYMFPYADKEAMAQPADYAIGFVRGIQPLAAANGVNACIVDAGRADSLASALPLNAQGELLVEVTE